MIMNVSNFNYMYSQILAKPYFVNNVFVVPNKINIVFSRFS